MDPLPLPQAQNQCSPSQRPSRHKAGGSQTTIDLYLRPIAKTNPAQNDIRNYFPPMTKTNAFPNDTLGTSSSPAETPAPTKPRQRSNEAAKSQAPGSSPCPISPANSRTSVPRTRQPGKGMPGSFLRAPNHNHVKSDVLPRFNPFFDDGDEFPHSSAPMAPRVTDVVRYSLVPRPLNFKPQSPTSEASRSPSDITSSPSSVGDPDTLSLYGERREAPSFKQTYLSVHSRHNTNDSPVSPLIALRDPSTKPLRQRMHRPATLRCSTAPKLSQPHSDDSVIYFLPEISPSPDSSADEGEPLIKTNRPKPKDKASFRDVFRAKRQAVKLGMGRAAQMDRKRNAQTERDMTDSPGLQRYYEHLASSKTSTPINEEKKEKEKSDHRSQTKKETMPAEPTGSGLLGKRRKKGTGFKRLMEAYSKNVEGLQMIQ